MLTFFKKAFQCKIFKMIYLLFYCIGILSACMSERVLDSLELKLLTVVSYHTGAGN